MSRRDVNWGMTKNYDAFELSLRSDRAIRALEQWDENIPVQSFHNRDSKAVSNH
jgi:hypothetical protein